MRRQPPEASRVHQSPVRRPGGHNLKSPQGCGADDIRWEGRCSAPPLCPEPSDSQRGKARRSTETVTSSYDNPLASKRLFPAAEGLPNFGEDALQFGHYGPNPGESRRERSSAKECKHRRVPKSGMLRPSAFHFPTRSERTSSRKMVKRILGARHPWGRPLFSYTTSVSVEVGALKGDKHSARLHGVQEAPKRQSAIGLAEVCLD